MRDSTLESLNTAHNNNTYGLVWHCDEGNKFMTRLTRYNRAADGEGQSVLIQGYNNTAIKVTRQKVNGEDRDLYIKHACISLYINLQTDLINEFFSTDDFYQRFAQRFLYIHLPSKELGHITEIKREEDQYNTKDQDYLDQVVQRIFDLENSSTSGDPKL